MYYKIAFMVMCLINIVLLVIICSIVDKKSPSEEDQEDIFVSRVDKINRYLDSILDSYSGIKAKDVKILMDKDFIRFLVCTGDVAYINELPMFVFGQVNIVIEETMSTNKIVVKDLEIFF